MSDTTIQDKQDFSLGQKAGVFVGSGLTAVAAVAIIKAPLPLDVAGLVGAYMLAQKSPQVYAAVKSHIPAPILHYIENAEERRKRGEFSVIDRLLGRHLNADVLPQQLPSPDVQHPETVPVPSIEPSQDIYNADILHLGDTFQPHASSILSMRIGIFGISGSGKSNALADFIEEIGRLYGVGVPFLLCDTEGEYENLHDLQYLTRPYKAGAHNVQPDTAFAFGQSILERGRQVILNLQSYEDDNDAALVMVNIVKGMRQWEEAHENEDRATSFVILDEASIWLPQRVEESNLSKVKDATGLTVLQHLQQAFFGTLVRRGRKRGIGFVFATQRPADLDKRAISCFWFFLFKQTYPNDLAVYAKLGVDEETAQSLQPGQAVVIDPRGDRVVHQFRKRRSPDVSATPGAASLKKYAAHWSRPSVPLNPLARGQRATQMEDLQPRREPSRTDVQKLDVKTISEWYESGKIDEARCLELLKIVAPDVEDEPDTEDLEEIENVPDSVLREQDDEDDFELDFYVNEFGNMREREHGNTVNKLVEVFPSVGNIPDVNGNIYGDGNTSGNADGNDITKVTEQHKIAILQTVVGLQTLGLPVTRRALRDKLGWSNRQFSEILKPVCDELHIAVRGEE